MDITTTDAGLLRLLQLSSASLPVGGYAFSQGLEYAIDVQWLKTSSDVSGWLHSQLHYSLARVDVPILLRQRQALRQQNEEELLHWNSTVLACRETRELLLSDTATGEALWKLLRQLDTNNTWARFEELRQSRPVSFVTMFAIASHHWQVNDSAAALGLLWSWLENQVAAATKLVPLGQTQAQRLLGELQQELPEALQLAQTLTDDELGASLPALAIASALHETQYCRLFRS